ncbi:DUF2279 domain-containing protein [Erythrobacter sp. KMU-140]|uniref:DUF2279 domain-containing protein n=2 Tax=Erythrobacter rubeus TaxID=2760803 RepID=A0ABR8KQ34_9SPHN|nr:DUF2279 domain-containing protein [Erythrobacter rubeus]
MLEVSPIGIARLDAALAQDPHIDLVSTTELAADIRQIGGPVFTNRAATIAPAGIYGPESSEDAKGAAIAESEARPRRPYASFGEDVAAIKWELAAVGGYYFAINAPKLFDDPQWPSFQSEGWFGVNTNNVGIDKLAHTYSTYIVSELLYARLNHKTGGAPGIQYTAAALASGIMIGTELFDAIEPTSGWSWEDFAMNTAGAGLSILRNSVPDLDQKLDFRLMITPNDDIYTTSGKEHFRQQRYFFALKLAGFEAFERSPFRLLELHLGYRGDDFLAEDRAAGIRPQRHIFVGFGLNFGELFFRRAKSPTVRSAGDVLNYFQLPYTAAHFNLTE